MPTDNMYAISFISLLVAAFLVLIVLIALTLFIFQPNDSSREHVSPDAIRKLLNPDDSSTFELLQPRALANQRLLEAFKLTNTFASPEITVHDAFVRQIKGFLREQRNWTSFLHVSRQAVASELDGDGSSTSAFANFIQLVTLRAVIVGLLDTNRDMDTLDPKDLSASATLIMKLWATSKTVSSSSSSATVHQPDDLSILNSHLRTLLPDEEKYPNPIDFVIPTWETLWRLVATCLARVYDQAEYRHVFEDLLEDPTTRRFHNDLSSDGLCAAYIMNETLRLHPPSRRISRSFPVETSSISISIPITIPKFTFLARWWPTFMLSPNWGFRWDPNSSTTRIQTQVANIEKVHLSTDIWGLNALGFEPRRWTEKAPATNFFAFGHGPLMCIGNKWAPMAAAMIVAAVLEGIEAEGLEIVGAESIGGRTGWGGWRIQKKLAETIM